MKGIIKHAWWFLLLSGLFVGIAGADADCDINVDDDDNDIEDIWDDIEDAF